MDGTPFGRYRLIELLGRGGMGEVWRAFDTVTERVVALKVLPSQFADDETYQQRFRREARSAAALDEPHVVPIYDFGEIDGRLFVTMRLIVGRDLQSILSDGPMDPARAVNIIDQVASALHAAHRVNLVHRDVKPSNILVAEDDFAYLIDFGIARTSGETSLTSTGSVLGTWAYLAPERMRSNDNDHRADIYALTCVMHECLTGSQPFPGDSVEQQLGGHLTQPPPRPSLLRADLPGELDSVIAKGMAKDPDERYTTTKELTVAARSAITAPTRKPEAAVDESAQPPTQLAPVPSGPIPSGPIPSGPGQSAPGQSAPGQSGPVHHPSPPPYAPAQFAPPSYPGPSAAPAHLAGFAGPPPAARRNNMVWVWAAAAAVVVVVVVVGVVVVTIGGSGGSGTAKLSSEPTSESAKPVTAKALDGFLLTSGEVNSTMGTTAMASGGHHQLTNNTYQVSPVACRVLDTLEADTYAGSAMTDSVEEQVSDDPTYHWLDQAVVLFPSARAAAAFATDVQPKWKACANRTYTVTKSSGESKQWSTGPVLTTNGTLNNTVTAPEWRCQQALRAANNVVVNVQVCSANATDEAINLTNEIAAKIPK